MSYEEISSKATLPLLLLIDRLLQMVSDLAHLQPLSVRCLRRPDDAFLFFFFFSPACNGCAKFIVIFFCSIKELN